MRLWRNTGISCFFFCGEGGQGGRATDLQAYREILVILSILGWELTRHQSCPDFLLPTGHMI